MDYIDQFMKHKIGIDIVNSDKTDIKEISDYILVNYPTRFGVREVHSLSNYYDQVSAFWEILVYETNMKCFNAYKNGSARKFREIYKVMTAAEMLPFDKTVNITENDIEDLLCLK